MRYGHWERGSESIFCTTSDPGELLYAVMADIAGSLSYAWELEHRVEGQDVRILAFQERLRLLERLSPAWAQRWRVENADIMREVGL